MEIKSSYGEIKSQTWIFSPYDVIEILTEYARQNADWHLPREAIMSSSNIDEDGVTLTFQKIVYSKEDEKCCQK